jgi:hypothetical protein
MQTRTPVHIWAAQREGEDSSPYVGNFWGPNTFESIIVRIVTLTPRSRNCGLRLRSGYMSGAATAGTFQQ